MKMMLMSLFDSITDFRDEKSKRTNIKKSIDSKNASVKDINIVSNVNNNLNNVERILSYPVERSARAKHFAIKVKKCGTVVIRIPKRMSIVRANAIAMTNKTNIEKMAIKLQQRIKKHSTGNKNMHDLTYDILLKQRISIYGGYEMIFMGIYDNNDKGTYQQDKFLQNNQDIKSDISVNRTDSKDSLHAISIDINQDVEDRKKVVIPLFMLSYRNEITNKNTNKERIDSSVNEIENSISNIHDNNTYNTLDVVNPLQNIAIQKLIRSAIIKIAKEVLPKRLDYLAKQNGFIYNTCRIRHVKSIFGSCSQDNKITLSSKLVLLEEKLIDYVIMHELTHTIHKNHRPCFWKELDKRMQTDSRVLRKILKKHHHMLDILF